MKQKYNDVEDFYPLSPLQHGLLFHALEAPHSGVYCEQKATELRGEVDVALLWRAWRWVAGRHAVLRTAFAWQGLKEPVQTVSETARAPWSVVDWTALDRESKRLDGPPFAQLQEQERRRGFDLRRAPLFRLLLVRLAADRHVLIWTHHHLLLDGWSIPLVLREVFHYYQGVSARGQAPQLAVVRPFKHYVAWLRKQSGDAAEAFWRRTLEGLDEPTPLPDRPWPHRSSTVDDPPSNTDRPDTDDYADLLYHLDTRRMTQLQAAARHWGVTFSSVVQAAWTVLLARHANRDDVLFGLVTSGRPPQLRGVEEMVGLFINTLPVREQLRRDDTWQALVGRLQAQGAERQSHGYESLSTVQGWSDIPRGRPLFESLLVLETFPVDALQVFHQAELELVSLPQVQRTHYPLTLLVIPGDDLQLHLVVDERRLERTFGQRLLQHFDRLLLNAVSSLGGRPDSSPERLLEQAWLSDAERHQLLREWNAAALPGAAAASAPSLAAEITQQARRHPDAIAIVDAHGAPVEVRVSYAELEHRSAMLASAIRGKIQHRCDAGTSDTGTGTGTLVALATERGALGVTAILAVLRAGACHVPLDTSLPTERLLHILSVARPALVLVDERSRAALNRVTELAVESGSDVAFEVHSLDALCLEGRSGCYLGGHVGTEVTGHIAEWVDPPLDATDPVYLLHTSGSTGEPKGVWLGHGALANMLNGCDGYRSPYRTLQLAAYGFDISFMEMIGTWRAGGELVLASDVERRDASALMRLLQSRAVERVTFPVVLLQQLAEIAEQQRARLPSLLRLASTGEALKPTSSLAAWLAQLRPEARLDNLYGPTETHVITESRLALDALLSLPVDIGRPIPGCAVHVVDRFGLLLPRGATGEMMLAGAAVALGYQGRPRLTAERFTPDGWSALGPGSGGSAAAAAGARVYRSGDLGRHWPDGRLEYLGRLDHQLKVRGFRVEPGEIEAALLALPEVLAAAVVPRAAATMPRAAATVGSSSAGVSLVAFVVLVEQASSAPESLLEALRSRLPAYMVPAQLEILDALPLNRNRKIDRRALAARARELETSTSFTAPRTPTEELLCAIWTEVLGRPVGVEEDFFALGGHSLLAMRLLGQVRARLGVELSVGSLFEQPTVEQQARHVEAALLQQSQPAGDGARAKAAPPLRPRSRQRGISDEAAPPLSFAQERLWFIDRLEPGSATYNIAVALELRSLEASTEGGNAAGLDVAALFAAAEDIVRRHEVLHTRYREVHGVARQLVAVTGEAAARPELALVDLSGLDASQRASRLAMLGATESRRPFDLSTGPVLRLTLVRLSPEEQSPEEHVVLLTVHHIASDGWSMGVFLRELAAFYGARVAGSSTDLPALPVQYADYAVWQRAWLQGAALEQQLDYWRRRLQDLPPRLELPADRPRAQPDSTAAGGVLAVRWPPSLWSRIAELGRRRGATVYMVLLAAFSLLLGRLTGRRDPVVGSPIAGRRHASVEDLIGFFVNTLVLRTELDGNASFVELLRQVRATALEAYAHQDVPFEKLVEELAPQRDLEHAPLFQVMFALQNTPLEAVEVAGLELRPPAGDVALASPGAAKFDLSLLLTEIEKGVEGATETYLAGVVEYRPERFDATTVQRWLGQLRTLLEAALDAPETHLDQLASLDAAARHQMLHEWGWTPGLELDPDSGFTTVDRLIAVQAQQSPDAVAVVDPRGVGKWLSYRELDRRADALAAFIASQLPQRLPGESLEGHVEPIVALALERGLSLIVALIATWRAGAAFLPLEVDQPLERLAFLLQDADVRLALVEHAGALPELPELRQLPREIWSASLSWDAPVRRLLDGALNRHDRRLAYLMYTSGSTGRPKGVAIPHRGIHRLVRQPRSGSGVLGFDHDDVFLQLAPVGFDASTLELWAPLTRGARLVLYPSDVPEVDRLQRILEMQRVDTLWLTAGLFHQLVEERPYLLRGVRRLYTGGDVVSAEHVRRQLEILPELSIIDGYGPTENTTFTTCHPIRLQDVAPEAQAMGGTIPIGRPLAGSHVVILDRAGRSTPIGVPGELQTGGAGLARGYFGRPALTAEKFVPNPLSGPSLSAAGGQRLYRTGDLARWRSDGLVEFLGRVDTQVKLRGFRIEPGEIEATLLTHPRVGRAAVVVLGADAASKRLEAALVLEDAVLEDPVLKDTVQEEADAVLTWLRARLPDYMVPSAAHVFAELPLTERGKVDRRALARKLRQRSSAAAPGSPAGSTAEPKTALERRMADLWAELLGRSSVGVDEDFFALGGHSLLAMRLVARVRQAFGVELPVRALFESPTVAQLAKAVETGAQQRKKVALPPLRRVPRHASMPLSFAQERLWFLAQLDPLSPAYNIPMALHLVGELEPAAFEAALLDLGARHEVLRTRFASVGGRPIQKISPTPQLQLAWIDISGLSRQAQLHQLALLTAGAARMTFDLARGPVLKVTMVRGVDDSDPSRRARVHHAALLTLHHIAGDGWSLGVLVRELAALYRLRTSLPVAEQVEAPSLPGSSRELPDLPVQYADFAVWQRSWLRGPLLEQQLAWWREQLRDLPPLLELPTDRPRPPVANLLSIGTPVRLGIERTARLKGFARAQGATLFMSSLAVFLLLLGRLAGRRDPVVGSPIAGRRHPAVENLIGFFVNTLVLRTDLAGRDGEASTFETLLARVRRTTLEAYAHQDLPFEKLVEELAPQRSLAYAPLFQVMFALQNAPFEARELPGLELLPLGDGGGQAGMAKFDLSLLLREVGAGSSAELVGEFEYCIELFDASTVQRTIRQYQNLVDAALASPQAPLTSLDVLSSGERQQLVREWGQGAAPTVEVDLHRGQASSTLVDLFLQQVEAVPDAVAVVLPPRRTGRWTSHLSYGELARRSSTLAQALRQRGVGPEVIVGLRFERSLEQMVALVAILYAGGAYLPLDPALPAARQKLILEDAGVELVLDASSDLAPSSATARQYQTGAQHDVRYPGSLAYVMYTSGSTGRPKGVACGHAGLLRLVLGPGAAAYGGFGRDTTWLQLVPTGFDVSTLEMWGSLLHGARLVLTPERIPSLDGLAALLAEQRIDRLWLSSGLLQQVVDERPEALDDVEIVFSGGDVVPLGATRRLLQRRAGRRPVRLVNGYGPTENAVLTTAGVVESEAVLASSVPIGRPVPGTSVYILTTTPGFFGPPVPVGVVGEVVTGGVALARGYLADPSRTAASFLPDPFEQPSASSAKLRGTDARGGARLYRTGDLARWLPDGQIDFLGRRDAQIQLRGFRIELGEIESLLTARPDVLAAAVLVVGEGRDDKRLVAFVVTGDDRANEAVTEEAELLHGPAGSRVLRSYLAEHLPAYMLPSSFDFLEAMPVTANGKLDRKSLLARLPAMATAVEVDSVARALPASELERLLADMWSELLLVEDVRREDDFFQLGGHSLLGMRLLARLRERLGIDLPVRTLFENSTLAGLAERLAALLSEEQLDSLEQGAGEAPQRATGPRRPPLRPRDVEAAYAPLPLSFAQERLWFLDQLQPGTAVYNIPSAFRLYGPVDVLAFQRAAEQVASRHEVLRTRFVQVEGEGTQRVESQVPPLLQVADLHRLDAASREHEVRRLALAEARGGFDLVQGPVLRLRLVRLASDDHALLTTLHHVAGDGWSMGVLVRELLEIYDARLSDRSPELPELEVQYADYALWQRRWLQGGVLQSQIDFWKAQLEGLPPRLELPVDRPRPTVRSVEGATLSVRFAPAWVEQLRHSSEQAGSTLFMTLLAGFQLLLGRHAHQRDFAVGSPVAGRVHPAVEPLIGFFINTLVLRARLDGNASFHQHLETTRQGVLEAFAHQDLPFEKLVEELVPQRELSHTPLFQVLFVLQNAPMPRLERSELRLEALKADTATSKFDLTLGMTERDSEGALHADFEYRPDLFDRTTIQRMADQLRVLLAAAVAEPDRPVDRLPLLEAAQRHQLALECAAPPRPVDRRPEADFLPERFLASAEARPDAIALVMQGGEHQGRDQRASYGSLAQRAATLAWQLRARGVHSETRVAVCLDRGFDLVVALLGISLASGVYVPLDPVHPPERLALILDDAAPLLVITSAELRHLLPSSAPQQPSIVEIENGALSASSESATTARPEALGPWHSDQGLYLIYTSGSTGVPKGVSISQANAARLFDVTSTPTSQTLELCASHRDTSRAPDTWALFHSYAFDMSVWELWGALASGGSLVVVPYGQSRDPRAFRRLLVQQRVSVLNQTPSAFYQLVRQEQERSDTLPPLHSLHTVVFGGEALDPEALRPWFERYGENRPRLVNMYGITEITVHATERRIGLADLETPGQSPIGIPLADSTLQVLDRTGQPVPYGVPGELYVGGPQAFDARGDAGLARGYHGRPALTASRFLPDAHSPRPGARLYRSGDLVRRSSSSPQASAALDGSYGGELNYLGRIDFQVQIRGFRVELGEVEAILSQHPAVRQAVVLARGEGAAQRLLGYVAASETTVQDLRDHLREHLPDYMVPAALVLMPSLPLTPNGKVDRRALPEPEADRPDLDVRFQAPRSELETRIAAIWQDVLELDKVGIYDSFFDLGGHSLLLVRVHEKLEEMAEREIPLLLLFQYPTIASLAEQLRRGAEAAKPAAVTEEAVQATQERADDRLQRARRRKQFRQRRRKGR